jgi:hypothetical protein
VQPRSVGGSSRSEPTTLAGQETRSHSQRAYLPEVAKGHPVRVERRGFLDGIELAPPEVATLIRNRARRYAGHRRPPAVCLPADFVPLEDAYRQVQSRWAPWPTINVLTARGYVQRCFRATDGEEGVTATSLAREVGWRRGARLRDHLRRLVRAVDEGV